MKLAFAVVAAVLAVVGAHAQAYYGVDPAPSMYAAQAGAMAPQGIPPAPSMDAIMAGSPAPYGAFAPTMQQQMMPQQTMAAFVEQSQAQAQQVAGAAPYFNTEEAEEEVVEGETEEDAADSDAEESEEVVAESEEGVDAMRFAEKHEGKKHHKKGEKKHHKKGEKKHHKKEKKHHKKGKKHHKKAKKGGGKKGKKGGKNGKKKAFKPKMGKPSNDARSPSAKTPKAAGGKKLPPMPAPLPKAFKINCKKNPHLCIDAETPAEGEEPGDHSPKAVFKKKMEVIKKSLMQNNRNIAAESKWIDQVELIMKQYALKVSKVKQHIADERKAIKELLRQRRIILNEKKQKELEAKLKMATTELAALTDALSQVSKKQSELGSGKSQLGAKIKLLVSDLKKLRSDKKADETAALKKADF